ncbi:unnamed protein product [Calypogeia fissa]
MTTVQEPAVTADPGYVQEGTPVTNGAPMNTNGAAGQTVGPDGQPIGKHEYIDKDGKVKKTKGGKLAACLAVCWCCTWPCHALCCCGL